jgi:hypothetical protein
MAQEETTPVGSPRSGDIGGRRAGDQRHGHIQVHLCRVPGVTIEATNSGAMNWAVGCKGSISAPHNTPGLPDWPLLPKGINESQNIPVTPAVSTWPSSASAWVRRS